MRSNRQHLAKRNQFVFFRRVVIIALCSLAADLIALPAGDGRVMAQESIASTDVESTISSVTVFRQQANIVRQVKLAASQDTEHIRVTGLPETLRNQTLRNQSVRWESDADITVRSIRVSPHEAKIETGDQTALDQQLERLNVEVQDASNEVAVIEQDLETIERLVDFSAGKAKQDLVHSKLEVDAVAGVADFVMQRRRSLAKEMHTARRNLQIKQRDVDEFMNQRNRDAKPVAAPTFDVLLTVDAPTGGILRLTYWVDQVSWEPNYTIRATSEPDAADHFVVQLDGKLTQNSGEDWKNVELSFCTGAPDLQANGPLLAPLRVSVGDGSASTADAMTEFGHITGPGQALPTWEDPASWQRNFVLNTTAAGRQVHEINRQQSVQRELAEDANNNLTDETYRVSGLIDVTDKTTDKAVTIFRTEVTSPIYRVVTPLLSSFAYREAALSNPFGQNLVGGDATVFMDGRFVGRTSLPPTAAGGEFAVGLGADRQVRTRRELMTRTTSIKGGNRLSKLDYRLVISNYHAKEVNIRLYDRIPISSDAGTVNVVTDSNSLGTLSDDAKYQRMQRPTGILRWDLAIPAKRFGGDAYDHHYSYTVEVDRTRSVVSNDVEQQMQNDLRFNSSGGGGMGGGMGGFGGGMGGFGGGMGGGGSM
ncbi:MAG: DUF4139 domain-containing protein [Planctomycetales bacterium]|nr:DUF4139 domain-containing protein [Planctomycetales bacterium]